MGDYLGDDEELPIEYFSDIFDQMAIAEAMAKSQREIEDEALALELQEIEFNEEAGHVRISTSASFRDNPRFEAPSGEYSQSNVMIPDDIDPDNMTYEQMNELGESVGSVSKGLSEERVSQLPTFTYKKNPRRGNSEGSDDECSICRSEYETGEVLLMLPCAHRYHKDCVKNWFKVNKVCCICQKEVSVEG